MTKRRDLHLTSPHMHGQQVKDAQWLLSGHGRFAENYLHAPVDGDYGPATARGTRRAKWLLGYKAAAVNGIFGDTLYRYLLPKTSRGWRSLPPANRVRRAKRLRDLRDASTLKAKALEQALHEAALHVHESPWGSNEQKYGAWYGLDGQPWCAIFFTYCECVVGSSRIFRRGVDTAWAYWLEEQARAGHPLLHLTNDPEPGDGVVYHHGQGHIERFYRWTDRGRGEFEAVGGNTSVSGSQDNGGAVLVRRRTLSWAPTAFVRIGE